jgi:hypothetical protein
VKVRPIDEVTHLIVGSGPVGSSTALKLAELGYRVRVPTRSTTGPSHPNIELVAGNANEVDTWLRSIDPAGAINNAANPPYNRWAQDWPPMHASVTLAAESSGAVLVVMDSLHAYQALTTIKALIAHSIRTGAPLDEFFGNWRPPDKT